MENRVGAEWDTPQDWTTRLLSGVFAYVGQAEHANAKRVGWRSTTSAPTKLGVGGGGYLVDNGRKTLLRQRGQKEDGQQQPMARRRLKRGRGQQMSVQNRLQLLHQGGRGRGCPSPSQNVALGGEDTSVSYMRCLNVLIDVPPLMSPPIAVPAAPPSLRLCWDFRHQVKLGSVAW